MTIEFDAFATDSNPGVPPRRRAAAVLGAAMLVAGAGGIGFGIGRSGSDSSLSQASAPGTEPAGETIADTVPDDKTLPTMPLTDDDSTAGTVLLSDPLGDDATPSAGVQSSGGGGWTMFGEEPMTPIAERVTDGGLVLRAQLGELWDQNDYGEDIGDGIGDGSGYDSFDEWQPPAWCSESGQVRIAISGGESTGQSIIDVGSVSWWTEPFDDRAVSAITMGSVDGNPYRVVFVQAPPDVTNVSVAFGDGSTDSVAPVDGVAILAVPGAGTSNDANSGWGGSPTDFDVTFDDGGAEPVIVDGERTGYRDAEFQASCSPPPPALPEAGEQPADPTAAEDSIVDVMTTMYSSNEDGGNEERIDDPTGVADAREQVREGSFEEAAANAEAIVEELVFTEPGEAWFRYRIETTTGTFSQRYGMAVDVDGVWKITRDTVCQDLSLAGGDCGGGWMSLQPPGADVEAEADYID